MTSFADDGGFENVGGGQQRAGFCRDAADGHSGPAMQSKDRFYLRADSSIKDAGVYQPFGAAAFFLGGLEYQFHADGELAFDFVQDGRCAEQNCHVPVMAAGVHSSWMGAGIGDAGLFLDWKGIDIRPEGNAGFGRVADDADRCCRGIADAVDVGNTKAIQFGSNVRGGFEFLKGEFGDAMKLMPQFGRVRDMFFDGGVRIHGDHLMLFADRLKNMGMPERV